MTSNSDSSRSRVFVFFQEHWETHFRDFDESKSRRERRCKLYSVLTCISIISEKSITITYACRIHYCMGTSSAGFRNVEALGPSLVVASFYINIRYQVHLMYNVFILYIKCTWCITYLYYDLLQDNVVFNFLLKSKILCKTLSNNKLKI